MKCPNCGSSRAKYKVSRKKFWGKNTKAKEPRKDHTAKCLECGYEFDAREVFGDAVVSQVKMKEKKKKLQIKMKYKEGER